MRIRWFKDALLDLIELRKYSGIKIILTIFT